MIRNVAVAGTLMFRCSYDVTEAISEVTGYQTSRTDMLTALVRPNAWMLRCVQHDQMWVAKRGGIEKTDPHSRVERRFRARP